MAGVARQKLRPSWRTQKDDLARARGRNRHPSTETDFWADSL